MCISQFAFTFRYKCLDNRLDLNAATKWNLRHAHGAARMGSSLFKDFDKQFGSAIRDHLGLREMRPTVDEELKFNNPLNNIQIADGGLKSWKCDVESL
jgi:hypothetical protein